MVERRSLARREVVTTIGAPNWAASNIGTQMPGQYHSLGVKLGGTDLARPCTVHLASVIALPDVAMSELVRPDLWDDLAQL